MKLCVVGAGAIGGVLGARLARAGAEVTLVVRNEMHRQAIAFSGLTIVGASGETHVVTNLRAVATCAEAGVHDAVILAVKAHQIAGLVPGICALFGTDTVLMTVQNGIPWWYFQRHGGPYEGRRIASLDPEGVISTTIEARRILGAAAYVAGEFLGPGQVRHGGGNRLPLGEIDGKRTARATALSRMLAKAGFDAPVLDDIRNEIWFKVWANACFNPIGALTRATVGKIAGDNRSCALLLAMMAEVAAIAAKLGIRFRQTAEERIAIVAKIAGHKPSMLQDVEACKALEIDALAGAIIELARLTETPTPHFDVVYACVKLLDETMAAGRLTFAGKPDAGAGLR